MLLTSDANGIIIQTKRREVDKMGIGERLRDLRKEKGLTLRELSEKVGITAAALSSYEKGQKEPSLGFAIKLAEFYEVSLEWLCRGETASSKYTYNLADIVRFIVTLLSQFDADISDKGGYILSKVENESGGVMISLLTRGNDTEFVIKLHRQEIAEFFETYTKLLSLCESKQIPYSVYDDWCLQSIERLEKMKLSCESAGEKS